MPARRGHELVQRDEQHRSGGERHDASVQHEREVHREQPQQRAQRLSERIHDELHLDTLEALEVAAHDGRLDQVPGIGARRAAAIRAALGTMLKRTRVRPPAAPPASRGPEVAVLLEVDTEYREKSRAGKLPTIAPRRFKCKDYYAAALR